ncbi:bi-domain-containing oxidoreductase [Caulobacter sp. FWC2]|uniref:bi-domain-containing oxidoreductase n=1 Tax=Caulobacter sp. FWC2 TaxID=69664 RepID=UPI000C155067|nr:bi-domain-containing oxidoreductase [Caulobacter sp. FWC2]PIB94652.1 dehydrogenase [Caulobacter sp. FWC2]
MKQVLQDLNGGTVLVEDVPAPLARAGFVRIATTTSLVSPGTERALFDFARGSLASKALQQPERVRQVLRKAAVDGVAATLEAVRAKLDEPMAVGYCNVGRVLDGGATGLRVGERVVSNGRHAGVVLVGRNLVARAPDAVDDQAAAFTPLAAIALQGVRLAAPTLGETFAVVGLGLVGLLTVQILRANGCRVLGLDPDPARTALARAFGATTVDLAAGEDPLAAAASLTDGRGLDGALLTLAATSDEPVAQAARMCRRHGRLVLVGVTGLRLNRADFYEKELSFQVSCSYGPGRHDPVYEEQGHDYPLGDVRWTEQRNFEAVLELMASGALDVTSLISARFPVTEAAQAYALLGAGKALGILLDYPGEHARADPTLDRRTAIASRPTQPMVGFLGAGAQGRKLMASFVAAGAHLTTVVSATGVGAAHAARRFGFARVSTDPQAVLSDPNSLAVCIATRHDSHADYVRAALAAGKAVFVEKPLCLARDDLEAIARAASAPGAPMLMVGFNRRFAPLVVEMRRLLVSLSAPKAMVMTVNAGAAAPDHWTQDPRIGGGRIVGEACHFIDLLRHLAGAPVETMQVAASASDVAIITLGFADGSIGAIHYLANGHRGRAKETLEVFVGGRTLYLDNYRRLTGHGWPAFPGRRAWRQDKGHAGCVSAFVSALRNGELCPIPLEEALEVSGLAIEAADQVARR